MSETSRWPVARLAAAMVVLSLALVGQAHASSQTASASDTDWALGYEIAEHDCKRPKVKKSGYSPGSQRERFERAAKRYMKCMKSYLEVLLEDHEKIMAITKAQSDQEHIPALAGKLKSIQTTVETLAPSLDMTREMNAYEDDARLNLRASGISDNP